MAVVRKVDLFLSAPLGYAIAAETYRRSVLLPTNPAQACGPAVSVLRLPALETRLGAGWPRHRFVVCVHPGEALRRDEGHEARSMGCCARRRRPRCLAAMDAR